MTPFLLQSAKHQDLDANRLRRKILMRSGELATWLRAGNRMPDELPEHLGVQQAIARDILLLDPGQRPDPQRFPWKNIHPFGQGDPTAGDMAATPLGMALYPLTGGGRSDVGLVAVGEEPTPFHVGPPKEGESWELACRLAETFRHELELRIGLASKWIVTGRCPKGESRVGRVNLGNKQSLDVGERLWILPAENVSEVILSTPYRLVPRLEDAVAHVSGTGPTDGAVCSWPSGLDVLNSFASGAKEPVIMAVVLSKPRHVVVWHSDAEVSATPARELEVLLPLLRCTVERKRISSSSLADAERTLRTELEAKLSLGTPLYFNITQGNRLMALAPTLLARRFPNLRLIYRNLDVQEKPVFDCIHFPGSEPVTQLMVGNTSDPRVCWPHLFKNNSFDPLLKDLDNYKNHIFTPECVPA